MRPRVLTSTAGMSESEWLAWRRRGIGGSEAAAVVGVDPWSSPMSVFLDKVGLAPPKEGPQLEWGRRLEAVVAEKFADEHPEFRVQRRLAILQHGEIDWMLANLDRELLGGGEDGPGVLEVKTAHDRMSEHWGDDEDDDVDGDGPIPGHYALQMQHLFAVTNRRWGCLAVLIGGRDYREYRVERDDALIADLEEIERDFWQHVIDGVPPEPDGHQATSDALAIYYADAQVGSSVELDPDKAGKWIAAYNDARRDEKAAKNAKELAKQHLEALLGEHELGLLPGIEKPAFTWKRQTSHRVSVTAVKERHPDVAAECTEAATRRQLYVPMPKEG